MGNDDERRPPPTAQPPPQPKRTVYGLPTPTPPSGVPQATPTPANVVARPQTTPRPPAVVMPTRVGTGPVTAQRGAQPTPNPPSGSPSSQWEAPSKVPTDMFREPVPTPNPQPPSDVIASGVGLEPGARVDKYELIRELGRGGMGLVFAARDTVLGRKAAIKFLLNATKSVAERFVAEYRATAQFQHENIVTLYDADTFEGMPYMVLEFLEGQTLRGVMGALNSGQLMSPSRVVELALPIARALSRAHELGIVHRDLKPENVFVTNAGQVKVLDFGIAKALGAPAQPRKPHAINRTMYPAADTPSNLTREGAMVGTLPYMSPEQMGIGDVDARSDIWALGIMIYEMLVGRHPIEPLTTDALITNAISDDPMPSIRDALPDPPEGLIALVQGCLRKRVVERIPNASEIVRRLEDLLPGRQGRQLAEGESPYPGLTAFQENDADRFFGRGRDVARMVTRVRELPITGIVGPSGVGKSSFIRAGVGPALKTSGEMWEVVTLRPGRQPLAALASVVQRLTTRSGLDAQRQMVDHAQMLYRLRNEPGYVGTMLRARARQTNGHVLLFVDQFEELYTLVQDPEERRAFTAALTGVADDTAAPLRVVVSMRSDFLDRIGEDQRFMEEVSRGLVFLQPPDAAGLREALVQPVEMIGYRFESQDMVDDMLAALAGMPGALPLLQFAASKLWDARDRKRRLLTMASYTAIGGISGALATHADDVVAQMNGPQQKLTQKIFRKLVTPERTRAIIELADLYHLSQDRGEIARIIDLLVSARLLVVQTRGDAGGGSAEIVHESLIDRWPTLRRWLDEDQEDAAFVAQLAAAAKQWEARGHAAGLLWRGDAMEEARRWYNHRQRELVPRDQAFLEAVFALARRGKRMRRLALVVVFIVLGGGAVAASVAAVMIETAKSEAERNEKTAEEATAKAKSLQEGAEQDRNKAVAALAAEKKAEEERATAEAAAQKAQTTIGEQGKTIDMDKHQLEETNKALNAALEEAKQAELVANAAKDDAVKAKNKAQKDAADLADANKKLAAANKDLKEKHEQDVAKDKERHHLAGQIYDGAGSGAAPTPAPTPPKKSPSNELLH